VRGLRKREKGLPDAEKLGVGLTFLKRAELLEGATEAGKGVKAYCVVYNF